MIQPSSRASNRAFAAFQPASASALKDAGATHVWGISFARQGMFKDDDVADDDGDAVRGVWL